jgi:hypothetical protein
MPCNARLTKEQVQNVFRQAGWNELLIPIMTAIAYAESSFCSDNYRIRKAGEGQALPESSWGLLQINILAHPQYNRELLISDPVYNAKAALDIFKKQGLRAWGSFTDGRYKPYFNGEIPDTSAFLGGSGGVTNFFQNPFTPFVELFNKQIESSESKFNRLFYKKAPATPEQRYKIVIAIAVLLLIFVFREF